MVAKLYKATLFITDKIYLSFKKIQADFFVSIGRYKFVTFISKTG